MLVWATNFCQRLRWSSWMVSDLPDRATISVSPALPRFRGGQPSEKGELQAGASHPLALGLAVAKNTRQGESSDGDPLLLEGHYRRNRDGIVAPSTKASRSAQEFSQPNCHITISRDTSTTGMPHSLPCDTCSRRRVKCDGKDPCGTCTARGQTCTYLKIRKRRGPKGPRRPANSNIQAIQKSPGVMTSSIRASSLPEEEDVDSPMKVASRHQIPVATYCTYIDIFRAHLYTVWPIVSTDLLKTRLGAFDTVDPGAFALAAAMCAATVAQLRLPVHNNTTSGAFARECLRFRGSFDDQRHPGLDSLLTSIFLHMYYANADQITLATFALRDAITYAHILNLGNRQNLDSFQPEQRQLRLRVYWILLVTERTFCMQHDIPTTLQTIDELPSPTEDEACGPALFTGFCNLVRLFTSIDGPLIQAPHSALESPNPTYSRARIREIQDGLQKGATTSPIIDEVQRVDIWITLAWLSSLLWQYSASHFMLSSEESDTFFAPSFAFIIARDFLSLVCTASIDSVRPHGYGMEIKLSQLANSLIDVLEYVPSLGRAYSTSDWGPTHAVVALEHLLDLVAGGHSERLDKLHSRMSRMNFTPGPRRPLLEFARVEGSAVERAAPHGEIADFDTSVPPERRSGFQCYQESIDMETPETADQSMYIPFDPGFLARSIEPEDKDLIDAELRYVDPTIDFEPELLLCSPIEYIIPLTDWKYPSSETPSGILS